MNGFAGFLLHSGTLRAIPETEYYLGFLPRLSELLSRASTRLSEILSRVLPRLSELLRRGFPLESLRTPETFRNTKSGYARNYYINQIHRDSPEQVSPELITYTKYTGILPNQIHRDSPEQVSPELITYVIHRDSPKQFSPELITYEIHRDSPEQVSSELQ